MHFVKFIIISMSEKRQSSVNPIIASLNRANVLMDVQSGMQPEDIWVKRLLDGCSRVMLNDVFRELGLHLPHMEILIEKAIIKLQATPVVLKEFNPGSNPVVARSSNNLFKEMHSRGFSWEELKPVFQKLHLPTSSNTEIYKTIGDSETDASTKAIGHISSGQSERVSAILARKSAEI